MSFLIGVILFLLLLFVFFIILIAKGLKSQSAGYRETETETETEEEVSSNDKSWKSTIKKISTIVVAIAIIAAIMYFLGPIITGNPTVQQTTAGTAATAKGIFPIEKTAQDMTVKTNGTGNYQYDSKQDTMNFSGGQGRRGDFTNFTTFSISTETNGRFPEIAFEFVAGNKDSKNSYFQWSVYDNISVQKNLSSGEYDFTNESQFFPNAYFSIVHFGGPVQNYGALYQKGHMRAAVEGNVVEERTTRAYNEERSFVSTLLIIVFPQEEVKIRKFKLTETRK